MFSNTPLLLSCRESEEKFNLEPMKSSKRVSAFNREIDLRDTYEEMHVTVS